MAFQIKGTPFINDNRELINIISIGSSSGVTTFSNAVEISQGLKLSGTGINGTIDADALSVTNDATIGGDANVTGNVDAATFSGDGSQLTGVLSVDSGGDGNGTAVIGDNLQLNENLTVSGDTDLQGLDAEASTIQSVTIKTGGSFAFADSAGFDAVGINSALAEDLAAETRVVSEKAIKQYVDGQIQETGGSVSFAGDSGSESFDISDGTFSIVGTANEIVTDASALSPDGTLQIGLSTSVNVEEDLVVGRNIRVAGVSTFVGDSSFQGSITLGDQPGADQILFNTRIQPGQFMGDVFEPTAGASYDWGSSSRAWRTVFTGSVDLSGYALNGVTNDLDTNNGGSADADQIPTAAAVAALVDGSSSAATLNLIDAQGTAVAVNLQSDTLQFKKAVDNNITVVADPDGTADGLAFGLEADITISSSLNVASGVIAASATQLTGAPGVDIAGDLKVSGNVDSASDAKLKENIEVIPAAMEKVAALRGVSYNWIASGKASAGVVAQEVQAVMPELVTEGEDHLTVQYNGLVGLLIEAVKEQQAQIDELKSQLG